LSTVPTPEQIPIIVGIGEIIDRPQNLEGGREPIVLMADALRRASDDAGVPLKRMDALDLVGQVTWRYRNPVSSLCDLLEISPATKTNESMGGETPVRLLHRAALQIAEGRAQYVAIVGGEAMNTLTKARKAGIKLGWTPLASREDAARIGFDRLPLSRSARDLGVTSPIHIYPFYENAVVARNGQSPAVGRAFAADLWARFAKVATTNEYSWMRSVPGADAIATVSADNRMVAWPYSKWMVANPNVNQSAAVIVTSLAAARAAGIADDRFVFLWGGAAAQEPEDFLYRDGFDHSTAQRAVLERAIAVAGGDPKRFDFAELYSCFPVVPRMAMETVKLREDVAPTVTGGLTFFGGPMNNYMTHAICAMTRALRGAHPGAIGLLYGQGGVVSKHHALVMSNAPPAEPLSSDISVQPQADLARGTVPPVIERYDGPARIETHSVHYDASGVPQQGVVVARTPDGKRLLATVPANDLDSLELLQNTDRSPVGSSGHVHTNVFGTMIWEGGDKRPRAKLQPRYCSVMREGPVTIVTIDRPDSMNALHPPANAELAQIFDEFEADSEQWVAILTGAGDSAFSSGNDLKYSAQAAARKERVQVPTTGFAGLTARDTLIKPVIAAVNGVAMGGGFEIALACDLIVASTNAVFALPEPKVGLAALAGGLHRLPRQIGLKRAMALILTGRRVTAEEGLALGFVNEVVPPNQLLQAARHWASSILECSPMSIRASKEVVMHGLEVASVNEAMAGQDKLPAVRALFRSDDIREGPQAFAEKRRPNWKGR
jgi:acetyl-CoA C-acetyltransferase